MVSLSYDYAILNALSWHVITHIHAESVTRNQNYRGSATHTFNEISAEDTSDYYECINQGICFKETV